MRLTLLLLAFTASEIALASNWTLVVEKNSKGDEILVDTASITKLALSRKAWVKYRYAKPQKVNSTIDKAAAGKLYSEMLNLMTFDCDQRTFVLEHVIFRDADGESISDQDLPYNSNDVPPDTAIEDVFKFVCESRAQ